MGAFATPAIAHDVSMNVSGKRVVITGASRGIGKALAERLARAGASLWLTGLEADELSAVDPGSLPLREARRRWLDPLEKEYLENLLHRHAGNISEAARAAEIDRQTIYRMLKKYGIRNSDEQG